MRQLKFRYYDDLLKRLVYSDEFEWTNALDKLEKFFQLASRYASNGVVQQYTGLQDQNGVDIYEGDIVRSFSEIYTNENFVAKVIYDESSFLTWIHKNDIRGLWGYDDIEVIGNIFENSEQLEV